MNSDDLSDDLLEIIRRRNQAKEKAEFEQWCDELAALPPEFRLRLKGDFTADGELQPLRWMGAGITLFESAKIAGRVQLAEGLEGPPIRSYLPYPVFQMAAEIFLKEMWLCQFPECRQLTSDGYLAINRRQYYGDQLKALGHDLLNVIMEVRKVPEYAADDWSMRFLKMIESIIRVYYFPLYSAGVLRWADARYPKRFYDDIATRGAGDNLRTYPPQGSVLKLFTQAEQRLDELWRIRQGLSARSAAQR